MKKASALLLALALLLTIGITPVFAAPYVTDYGQGPISLYAYSVQDLGTNGSVGVNWYINDGATVRSAYNYKTGSGKIILNIDSSASVSCIFYLFDSTDTLIGGSTVTLSPGKTAMITFKNLITSREYYVKAENIGQGATTLSGTISAS